MNYTTRTEFRPCGTRTGREEVILQGQFGIRMTASVTGFGLVGTKTVGQEQGRNGRRVVRERAEEDGSKPLRGGKLIKNGVED